MRQGDMRELAAKQGAEDKTCAMHTSKTQSQQNVGSHETTCVCQA